MQSANGGILGFYILKKFPREVWYGILIKNDAFISESKHNKLSNCDE